MNRLPETGFVRVRQIIGDPKAKPPVQGVIPVGRTTWWKGVKSGRFPSPIKLSPGVAAWRVADIRALIEQMPGPEPAAPAGAADRGREG